MPWKWSPDRTSCLPTWSSPRWAPSPILSWPARRASLVSAGGGIVVNRRLQTSDPDIYAGGDCIDNHHLITGKPVYFPSGSLANRQGRVIGTNLAGGSATFNGIVGSFTLKTFEMAIAGTGLNLAAGPARGL